MPEKKATASFIEPMLLQRTAKIPEGPVDGEVINHAAMGVWYNPLLRNSHDQAAELLSMGVNVYPSCLAWRWSLALSRVSRKAS